MPHILITDDDPHLRRLVRTYAELEGFECTEAGDGAAAVTALKQSAFDLVLLDVMMPGPDGFETLEAIRGFSQVPVIMLTARNEEYDKLFNELKTEMDPDKREDLIFQMQQILIDDAAVLIDGYYNSSMIYSKNVGYAKIHTADYYWLTTEIVPADAE